jgi:hypothetical protein
MGETAISAHHLSKSHAATIARVQRPSPNFLRANGAAAHRLRVSPGPSRRRPGTLLAGPEPMTSVADLREEHERLLAELRGMLREIDRVKTDDLRAALVRFGHALQRHLQAEERALDSVPRGALPDPERIARTLEREHEDLRMLVIAIHDEIVSGELLAAHGGIGELEVALRLHALGEEQVLFPMLARRA